MKGKKAALILLSVVVIASLIISGVHAGSAAAVSRIYLGVDPNDHHGVVDLGATVYIYWDGVVPSDLGNTVDITVIKPDGSVLTHWYDRPPSASGALSFVANMLGTYLVILDGHPTYYMYSTVVASASIFVLPESILGTSVALVACFSAVGVLGVIKIKRSKTSQ